MKTTSRNLYKKALRKSRKVRTAGNPRRFSGPSNSYKSGFRKFGPSFYASRRTNRKTSAAARSKKIRRRRIHPRARRQNPFLIYGLSLLIVLCLFLCLTGSKSGNFLNGIFTNNGNPVAFRQTASELPETDKTLQDGAKQSAFILSQYGIPAHLQRGIRLTGQRIERLTGKIQESQRTIRMLEMAAVFTEKNIDNLQSQTANPNPHIHHPKVELNIRKNYLIEIKEEISTRSVQLNELKNQLELHQRFLEQIKMEYNLPAIIESKGSFNPQALISSTWYAKDWPEYSRPESTSEVPAAADLPDQDEDLSDPVLNSDSSAAESLPRGGPMDIEVESWDKACAPMGFSIPSSWSEYFIRPVSGWLSAGTWAYPGGGLHLGADFASPLKTPVLAPAHGVILYADVCADENGGYLGNYAGWPYGGGNTLAMICMVEGELFAITFAHLSQSIYVQAGMEVEQGTLIALSGNSGNSTGPHTHIEVFRLHVSLEEAISYFLQGADFSFGTGWNEPAACSAIACQIRPEEIFG